MADGGTQANTHEAEIRELKQRLAAAEAQLERLRERADFYGDCPLGIFRTTPDGRLLGCNQSFAKLFGFESPEDMRANVGNIKEIYAEPARRKQAVEAMLAGPGSVTVEQVFRRRDGSLFGGMYYAWASQDPDTGDMRFDGFIQQSREVEVAAQSIAEVSGRVQRIVDALPLGALVYEVIDEQPPRLVSANPAVGRILGIDEHRLIGKTIDEIFPPLMQSEVPDRIREVATSGTDWFKPVIEYRDDTISGAYETTIFQIEPAHAAVVFADVSERIRAEKALRASEREKDLILSSLSELVIFFGPDLHILWMNRAARETMMHQSGPGEPGERHCFQRWFEGDRPCENCPVRRAFKSHHAESIEQELPDGRLFDLRAYPVRDEDGSVIAVVEIGNEVTERRRTERALRASEERFRAMFEASPLCVVLAGLQEGRIVQVNHRMCDFLGYSAGELIGRPIAEITFADDIANDTDRVRLASEQGNGAYTRELRYVHRDGHPLWARLTASMLHVGGEGEPLVLGLIEDIRAAREAEHERRALEAQVQHAQKLESLGVLAGGIAHDFNNLLMAILGNADLALQDLSSANPARASVLEIEKAARRAAELCRQMLAYSGKGTFVVAALDLNEVVREMAHLLEVSISKKAVLRYNLADNLPSVRADATQMRQIVMNLITNASDAIGDRSGIIMISTGAMQCDRAYLNETYLDEGLAEGMYIYLEVADTGCGIDPQNREQIFDPFFTTKFTGRGLGLAAVLGIVRGHKGAIKVYSETGKGTTFKVLLPALAEPAEHLAHTPRPDATWRGRGLVLLVDDEETIRAVGTRMLERLGFEVVTAADGREAVEIFRKRMAEIVCVVLDLTMPHMDGEQTFRELRRLKPDVRVLMSSGYNQQEITQRFAGKGLAGFIQKPYRSATLQAVLRSVLGE